LYKPSEIFTFLPGIFRYFCCKCLNIHSVYCKCLNILLIWIWTVMTTSNIFAAYHYRARKFLFSWRLQLKKNINYSILIFLILIPN
jgi:uncharacterized membrane protein